MVNSADPQRVGILTLPDFALMSYAALVEPMRAANRLAGRALYRPVALCPGDGTVTCSAGLPVRAEAPLAEAHRLGLLFVVAGGDPVACVAPGMLAALRKAAARGTVLGGVSGGPVVLARAGLMDGRRMTVHWEHAEALREAVPGVLLERALYVIDRDRITCAGGMAPSDMMHALIARDHGPALARMVSDWFLHTEVRPAEAAQRAGLADRWGTTSAPLLRALAIMEAEQATPLALGDLAARAGVSARHLSRLFQTELARSPLAVHRQLRLATARRLVEQSSLPIGEIAYATGFASPAHLSRAFRDAHGTAPRNLRRPRDRSADAGESTQSLSPSPARPRRHPASDPRA